MRYSAKNYGTALYMAITESSPGDLDKILANMAEILKQNGDLGLLDQIETAFLEAERSAKGIKQATVTTAKSITRETEATVVDSLNAYLKARVELRKQVDERLVGGIVIRAGDELLDASVKKNLELLKNELTK